MKQESYFENAAGEKFRFVEIVPENPFAAILAVHGYAEHIGRYEHIASFFSERGFSFYMMENRGHGMSVGKRGHIDKFDIFLDDLHFFRKIVERKINGLPLFGLAHSNGSLILARYSLKYGHGFKGLVLSGIPIRSAAKINPIKFKAGMLLAAIVPKLTLPSTELDPQTICHDKKVVDDYIKDPLVHKVISVRFAREFFWAMEDLNARAKEFTAPVLFQHGSDDRACDPDAAREFYENIASQDKEFIMYEALYHEVYNEPPKHDILTTAADWMKKRMC